NMVTVKVGAFDSVDLYQQHQGEVIVDLLGYYAPVVSAVSEGRFVRLDLAARAIDTRETFGYAPSRSYTPVDLTDHGVPADASSVFINLTVTECTSGGFFSALPAWADESKAPSTSSLNVMFAGDTRAGSAIVPISTVGGRRRIKIYSQHAAKLIVDVNGYYTSTSSPSSTSGLFVPLTPVRLLDTRDPGQIGKLWPGWSVEAMVPGEAANGSAVVLNVTGVDARGSGFLTVSGAKQRLPLTSNLNLMGAGSTVPNHVVTPITAGYGFQVYSSRGAHVLADLAGYFTGTPLRATVSYENPPPPPAPPPWVIRIPRLGLTSNVYDGDPIAVTNSGHTWHWTGTGWMGQAAHVAVFGHRTEYGGPYRQIHTMLVGDTWTVTTADNREYTYRMVRRDLTGPEAADILAATRSHPGTTMSLIACTVGFDSSKSGYPDVWAPTSIKYRIVVTGQLLSSRQL
ncbi:MAG TPA: sortase, partial [Ilumatobacter sp.]|nr:sortase [Ilumatobacter sp.]